MRKAHFLTVFGELDAEFAIIQCAVIFFGNAFPRIEVHFINRNRLFLPIRLVTHFDPLCVIPLVAGNVGNDTGVVRRRLEGNRVRVNLAIRSRVVLIQQFEFILRTGFDARNEHFPNTGSTEHAHRVIAAVPTVEITDDGNAAGRRRPNRKRNPANTVDFAYVRTELFVNAVVIALVNQIQIAFRNRRPKRIAVGHFGDLSRVVFNDESVGKNFLIAREPRFEKSVFAQAGHRRLATGLNVFNGNVLGVAQVGAHDNAAFSVNNGAVHAQKVMRMRLNYAGERLKFCFGDNHSKIIGVRFCVGDKQFERQSSNRLPFCKQTRLLSSKQSYVGGFRRIAPKSPKASPVDFSLLGRNGKPYNARNEHIRV